MMRKFLLLTLVFCGLASTARTDDFWALYERYPHMQDFFPFGIYGGSGGEWSQYGHDPRGINTLKLEKMAEIGLNAIWHTAFHRDVRRFEIEGRPAAELTDYGRWFFGEALPDYGFKVLPSFQYAFTRPALSAIHRNDPLLSDAEIADVAEHWQHVLALAGHLTDAYPDTVFALVSDDEPDHIAPMEAADRLLRAASGRAVTTCIPGWGQSRVFARYMQPFTGDWYVTGDQARNNWAIARNLDWMRQNLPDRVFWFLPLASAYSSHEPTKPGWPDARPQPVDLRMQFWMAIAGGAKGFYYYNLIYGVQWARGEDNLLSPALYPNNDLWAELGRLAPMITSAGPLLLPCQPLGAFGVGIEAGRVRYAEYDGPAVSAGVLRDIHRDRFFLVPYSNDLHERQSAVLTLPPELAGRPILDLASLQRVTAQDGRIRLELDPGDGRLLLLADDAEIADATDTVRRHRAGQARRRARIALRRARPADAGELQARAEVAEAESDWTAAAAA